MKIQEDHLPFTHESYGDKDNRFSMMQQMKELNLLIPAL